MKKRMNDGELLAQATGKIYALEIVLSAYIQNLPELGLIMLKNLKERTAIKEKLYQQFANESNEQAKLIDLLNKSYEQKIAELIRQAEMLLAQQQLGEQADDANSFLFSEKKQ